ncbi:MAG: oligoribonuclease [Psychromonas sp.]
MNNNLIWIDLEMTGLNPETETIIEIATVVTDSDLNVIAEGPEIIIHECKEKMDAMDQWCVQHHGESGLTERVIKSNINCAQAEQETLAFLEKWTQAGASPLCGNSIGQDRRFLVRYMPQLEAHFHYRNIDVSSIKELGKRWAPEMTRAHKKQGSHLAMMDIKESISELQHYREHFFKF